MNIFEATHQYEKWLAQRSSLVPQDLKLKHTLMKRDVFSFFRATFFRWTQIWPEVCGNLVEASKVLAIGDLHVENFGTWRDDEGRLVWGVNDFDETSPLPYTNDLVRLSVSAILARETEHLALRAKHIDDALLTGYEEGLEAHGRPFVLAEQHGWLRRVATNKLRDPVLFWKKLKALPQVTKPVPLHARTALELLMPAPGLPYTLHRRVSGLGNLGRLRFVALADWQGGKIAREAKALSPSACLWAQQHQGHEKTILYERLLSHAVRCRDPFVRVHHEWLVRRLSPYCSRIELSSLPKRRDEGKLLYAMGWETANVHLGSGKAITALRRDLAKRKADWLLRAAKSMVKATVSDWKDWVRK